MTGSKISSFCTGLLAFATCLCLFILPAKKAGANTADSLLTALKAHPKNDAGKVSLLCDISMAFINNNIDTAIYFANEGLSIAQSISFEKGESSCLQALGIAYLNKNEYDKALKCYTSALQIAQKIDVGIALIYCHIGDIYARSSKHTEAIEYYKKSISLSEERHETDNEALAHMNIANLYSDMGDYSSALKYYFNALKIFEKEQHEEEAATCMSNISTACSSMGDYKRALDYNNQSLVIFQRIGNRMGVLSNTVNLALTYGEMGDYRSTIKILDTAMALSDSIGDKYFKIICLANIGEAYYNVRSYDTAYTKYKIALREAKKVNDQTTIAQAENGIGSVLIKKGKAKDAIPHLLTSYNIMQQAGLKVSVQEIALNLSEAYEKSRDLASALKYYKVYYAYNDSLSRETNDKRVQQLQFDYELNKKESQISLLQKDKVIAVNKSEKQSAIIWAASIVLLLLIIVSTILYSSRAYEKRSKEEIMKQKEEIQAQATNLAELNRFKDKTFSVLSHDLRGPIDSFYSIIKLLDNNTITTEEYMLLKPEMTAQIASLTILLDNLLKWSSSNMKGQIAAKPANTNIHNIARQNTNILQSAANHKNITLNNEIPRSIYAICDPGQIDIVIRNITINAIKFTPHNGTITLSATSDHDNTYISIADTGVGMTQAQLDKLFTTTIDNHTYGTDGETGTGLGLLLCYEFVKANNGTITVSSEKDKGSKFTIILKNQGA